VVAGATVGASSVFWWLFLGVVFFVPYALICSEMGTTYPEQGGLYAWVRHAFGRRWASRATWAYWVNTSVWMPAIYILFAGIFGQMFMPDLPLSAQIGIGILLTWMAVIVNVVTLNVGKWIPNVGAIFKVVVILAIVFGAILHTRDHGMANPLTLETMKPTWDNSLQYISVIVYGMLGFELVSAGSKEMKNPARDIPTGIFVSGLVIIVLYVAATVAILAAIPAAEVNLVEGLMATLYLFFDATEAGRLFALLLGIGALYTFFSNGVTWALGCNRSMAEAAAEGEFPAVLAYEHPKSGTPVGAAVIMGIVSTLVLVLYGVLAGSKEELFWSLFAFSAVIFLIPYIILVFAFLRMRHMDPDRHRPFLIPGGEVFAKLITWTCAGILGLSMVLFCYTPGEGMQWPVFVGAVVITACGELVIRITEARRPALSPA
jgi:amino acid transporter